MAILFIGSMEFTKAARRTASSATFRTLAESQTEIVKLCAREMYGRNWAEQYHNRGFVVRETVVQTDFEMPPHPKPRDRYFVRGAAEGESTGNLVEHDSGSLPTRRGRGRTGKDVCIRTKLQSAGIPLSHSARAVGSSR